VRRIPGASGFTLVELVIAIVVLTSSDERDDVRGAYARGANSYFRKPVEFSQFTTMLAEVGHYWLDLNSRPQA